MHAQRKARQGGGGGGGAKRKPVPVLELWVQVLKGSARAKRSGSRREVAGDCSPSISFSGSVLKSGREGKGVTHRVT